MERFNLILNGAYYGSGDKQYMLQLIEDYIVACDLYGKDTVQFQIDRHYAPQLNPDIKGAGDLKFNT